MAQRRREEKAPREAKLAEENAEYARRVSSTRAKDVKGLDEKTLADRRAVAERRAAEKAEREREEGRLALEALAVALAIDEQRAHALAHVDGEGRLGFADGGAARRSPKMEARTAGNSLLGIGAERGSGGRTTALDKVAAQGPGMSGPKLSSQPQIRQAKSLQNKDSKTKQQATARSKLKKRMLAQPLPT